MPRKSLMGFGKSPRINFRMDEEVNQILQETKDKSKFIREAIIHYWEYLGNGEISVKMDVQEEKVVKIKKSEIKSDGTWNPPWLSR